MHKNITFSAICLQPCKALQGSPSPPLQHPFGDSRGDFFLLFCKLFFEKNPHICAFFAFIASFILSQIRYKSERYGRQLVSVSRFFASSQLCSVCGYKYPRAKRLTVRNWTCPVCGAPHDRDANAATNILHEGLRLVNQASAA